MSKEKPSDCGTLPRHLSYASMLWTTMFVLMLIFFSAAISVVLFRQGNGLVILGAVVLCALILVIEHVETAYGAGVQQRGNPHPGSLLPMVAIVVVAFAVCLPTLNSYFLSDDFSRIHQFHKPSLSQLMGLFFSDLSPCVKAELRPTYGLPYIFYHYVSDLHPLGYHVGSATLHAMSALMVFLIVRNLPHGDSWSAGLAGLLFAVVPYHAETISWISASLGDGLPSLFYLMAFLFFQVFRQGGSVRYLTLSGIAFSVSLLGKEIAVTLPLMLLAYDFFQVLSGRETLASARESSQQTGRKLLSLALPYLLFATVLVTYLVMRRATLGNYLDENLWGTHVAEALSSAPSLAFRLYRLWLKFVELQDFNLRQLLLPFPAAGLALVLGTCLVWSISLLRNRSTCGKSMAMIVYFGVIWYLVANIPLLVAIHTSRHLYLASVGPCIALAFLARSPLARVSEARYTRLMEIFLVVSVSFFVLWKLSGHWNWAGEISQKLKTEFPAVLRTLPNDSLVVAWAPLDIQHLSVHSTFYWERWDAEEIHHAFVWGWAFPYVLQEPFYPTDLYARFRIIEHPDLYWCGPIEWGRKTMRVLNLTWHSAPEGNTDIYLVAWDQGTRSVKMKRKTVPTRSLRARVQTLLGQPPETVATMDPDSAYRMFKGLFQLFEEAP